jgi:gliding motility-associated-like protein
MRSRDTAAASYTQIGTVPAGPTSPIVFTDNNVLTDEFSYYYKVVNVDSCGFDGIVTNIGRTMLVKARGNSADNTNAITWNDYENWLGNVMSYNIYRGIDGVMDPVPIANVPFTGSGINTYVDYVASILTGEGVFNYYVEALEGMGNPYGFSDNATSNIAEAYQDALVHVPNAFRPSGYNSMFIPVTTYVDIQEYEFDIFNRWGLKMFSTTDVDQGWDGTHGGTKCEFGVYVYLLRFKTSRGEYIERKGTVTLLR